MKGESMYCRKCGAELVQNAKFCHRCGISTVADETGPEAPSPMAPVPGDRQPPRSGRRPGVTLLLSFLLFVNAFVFQVLGFLVGMLFGDSGELSATIGSAVGALLGIVVLGGKALLKPSKESLAMAFKKGWWAVMVSFGLFVFEVVETFVVEKATVVSDWPVRMIWLVMFCAAIGLAEEGMFRGLLLGGILDVKGSDRRGVVAAAMISALLFGVAHVEWWAIDYVDALQLVQAVLKVLQTGTLGFFLAALVIRGRSIWGAAIIHGLDDFLLMIPSIGLLGQSAEVEYVTAGENALPTIILYTVIILLYLPLVIKGRRLLKDAPAPDHGAFHKGDALQEASPRDEGSSC